VSKVRVYELAKETGLPNREVIRRLDALGVEARSHSSTVEDADASRFRSSLGRLREERQRRQEERDRREVEEYDLTVPAPPREAKARRILPPHLQSAQAQAAAPAPAEAPEGEAGVRRFRPPTTPFRPSGTSGVSVGGEDAAAETSAPPAQRPAATPFSEAPPAPAEAETATPADQAPERPITAADRARQGVVRPASPRPEQPRPDATRRDQPPVRPTAPAARGEGDPEGPGTPGVPRPGTPPRPGQSTIPPRQPLSPLATGEAVTPRRRVETDLPREGPGRRAIPPPLRAAPQRPQQPQQPAASAPSGAGVGRPQAPSGAPGRTGAPGRPSAPGAPTAPAAPGGPDGGAPGRGRKSKRDKRRREPTLQDQFEATAGPRQRRGAGPVRATVAGPIDVTPDITVGDFAQRLGVNATDIVRILFGMGQMITVTQSLTEELIELVALELEADVRIVTPEELEFGSEAPDDPADLVPRAPVVTVMGHVDHGKTLLLDAIRSTDVVSREAGGITQHIGAYQVTKDGRTITFIDTPGHEAFTAMRARGASVTDVVILVVAADDGVKPQTVEAISHIKAAEAPIIVAVNKIDKEGADPTRVRSQLTEYDLVAEEFGGQTTMVNVSAKTHENLDELLELVLLQSDVMDLQANPHRRARGAVIEGNLDRGRGAVATVLVQAGTLRIGDNLVAGIADCRVRAMFDDDGRPVTEAGPSQPVEVLGWNEVPEAGDEFRVVADERTARDIASNRASRQRRLELAARRTISLDDLPDAIARGQLQTLNLIVKGDVSGSVEAIVDQMNKLELPEVRVSVIHRGVGAVNENDVNLAETSSAIIIAFNVRPDANARQAIERSGVDLRQYSIIYQAVEDIENAVRGLLAPEFEEVTTGRAQVREIFRVPRVGFVFGCYVTEGELRRGRPVRVIRDGVVVAQDTIGSLRRFKEDVVEVATGFECGVGLDRFQDVKVGDEFEVYESREVARA
jgi:translation initiation factor IF-2